MNKIEDPWTGKVSIIAECKADKRVCRRALGAAQVKFQEVLAIDSIKLPSIIDAEVTEEIARGLAVTALGRYGVHGFSGLTQVEADARLKELSGDVKDFSE